MQNVKSESLHPGVIMWWRTSNNQFNPFVFCNVFKTIQIIIINITLNNFLDNVKISSKYLQEYTHERIKNVNDPLSSHHHQ